MQVLSTPILVGWGLSTGPCIGQSYALTELHLQARFISPCAQGKQNSPFLLRPGCTPCQNMTWCSEHLAPETSLFLPFAGYTVTSVVSSKQGRVYVAGAPRFNHTGKVILFTMHNNRSLTIHQALPGEQVMAAGGRLWARVRV